MQTWITDYDIAKSAANLDDKRLFAQIYEGIHILASLLGVNDRLVNSKRDVSNHPAAKLWTDNIRHSSIVLYYYICDHIYEYKERHKNFRENFKTTVTCRNLDIIIADMEREMGTDVHYYLPIPNGFITDELIQTHRSVLIQKKPEHYRPLWPDCPGDLVMRYYWK